MSDQALSRHVDTAAHVSPEVVESPAGGYSINHRKSSLKAVENSIEDGQRLHFGLMVGESPAMRGVYRSIEQLEGIRVTVLIQGESGSGKEFAAQALHEQATPGQPFVAVNCGVFTPELIASELFGHEKGSFTGALQRRRGYFERAHGGTLFLDEITEMPADLQVALLRVLECGSFVRVGGETQISADVRVIAATNCNPREAVRQGKLREDLYYRLSAFPLIMPPLRERSEDVPLLVEYFVGRIRRKYRCNWQPSDSLLRQIQAYDWPGNVRELKHALHRAYLLRERGEDAIVDSVRCWRKEADRQDLLKPGRTIADMEKMLIMNTLKHYSGDKEKTAKALGICLKTLYNRLNRYDQEDGTWH